MPAYEFVCPDDSEHRVTKNLPAEERDSWNPVCMECLRVMKRRLGLGGISFRGTGWARSPG